MDHADIRFLELRIVLKGSAEMMEIFETIGEKLKGMSFAIIVILHRYLGSIMGAEKGSGLDFLAWLGAIIIVISMVIIPLLITRWRWIKHKQGRLYRLAKKHPRLARIVAFLRNAWFTAHYAIPESLAIARKYWEMSAQTCNKEIDNALIATRTEAKEKKIEEMKTAKERERKLLTKEAEKDSELAKLEKK